MFNPNRLILARERRKLTRKELAERIKISPVTITRNEKGTHPPESNTVDLFVKELNFPKEFFYSRDFDKLTKDSVSFRSLSSMTAKERKSAIAAGSISHLLSDWINNRFNLPKVDLLDLGGEYTPDAASRVMREHWNLGEKPVSNVIKLLESKGVRVYSLVENTKNVDAFSCWRKGIPYIYLNTFKTAERSRFDALHELGHLVLHRHGSATGKEIEIQANQFSSSFLMPENDVLSKIPYVNSLTNLIKYKRRWGVSVAALAYRLHKLHVVSDWQYRTFCIEINKQFGKNEPNGLEREKSFILKFIFTELWKEGVTRKAIAKDLHLPLDEINNMITNILDSNKLFNHGSENTLKIIK